MSDNEELKADPPDTVQVQMPESDWNHARKKESENATHPCDAWEARRCMCKGSCDCHTHAVTVRRRVAETFEFQVRGEYATFTIDQDPARRYFNLGIESSFGGYAFAWRAPGGDFKRFLVQLDCGYVLGKMVGADEVYSAERTYEEIRKDIERLVQGGELTEPQAEHELMQLGDVQTGGEADFYEWTESVGRVARELLGDALHEFYRTEPGARSREFTRLYELFWPALRAALVEEASS